MKKFLILAVVLLFVIAVAVDPRAAFIALSGLSVGVIIKMGTIVTEARGKLGGHVFSRNTYGNYMRSKVTPSNPASAPQVLVRARFTTAAQGWRSKTDAVRASFLSLAADVKRTNIFGDNVPYTPFNLWIRLNREISEVGGTQLTVAPAIPAISSVTSLILTGAAGTPALSAAYLPTPVPSGFSMVVQFSPQLSQGINFIRSQFRTVTVLAESTASPLDALSLYTAKFGTLVATKRVAVRAKFVHKLSGFCSGWYQTSCIIAA